MYKNDFKKALHDALTPEYEEFLSQPDIEHEFSPEFEEKMNKLINRQKKPHFSILCRFKAKRSSGGIRKSKIALTALCTVAIIALPFVLKFSAEAPQPIEPISPEIQPETISPTEAETKPVTEIETAPPLVFKSDKEKIFHMMLNTVDYFDKASGEFYVADSNTPNRSHITFVTDLESATAFSRDCSMKDDGFDELLSASLSDDFSADDVPDLEPTGTFSSSLYCDGTDFYTINEPEQNCYTKKAAPPSVKTTLLSPTKSVSLQAWAAIPVTRTERMSPTLIWLTNAFFRRRMPSVFFKISTFGKLRERKLISTEFAILSQAPPKSPTAINWA